MEELNVNTNNLFTQTSSNEQRSSSFVLQPSSTDDHHEENVPDPLKLPLLISQIYKEEFFDRVSSDRNLSSSDDFLFSFTSIISANTRMKVYFLLLFDLFQQNQER